MTERDESATTSGRWAWGAVAVVVVGALLFWLARAPDEELPAATSMPDASRQQTREAAADPSRTTATVPGAVAAPKTVIEDKGRLTVSLSDLREGDVYAVGLAMPDDVRGNAPLATKVIDPTRERLLETEAVVVNGEGTGVRLEIDPEWLEPGRYMIQIETNEKSQFPIRRYVLEVE